MSELVNTEDRKNPSDLICQICQTVILKANMATLTNKEMFLPFMKQKSVAAGATVVGGATGVGGATEGGGATKGGGATEGGGAGEGTPDGETTSTFWLVHNMYTFENIGFTKPVGATKYLICAECEVGPIGWHLVNDTGALYLAPDRVTARES